MFLDALDAESERALRALGRERTFARGETLFREGDDAGGAMIVLEGRLKVALLGREGKEVVLGMARPGELVGELSALDDGPRTTTVSALGDVRVLAIPRAEFQRFLRERPEQMWSLVRVLAARLRTADAQRTEFASYDVLGRVTRRLVELAEDGDAVDDAALGLTQDDLAAWTGASREAVSRALTQLRALGWIETHRRRIVVRDLGALRDFTA